MTTHASDKIKCWTTGAERDGADGKGRFDLISPISLLALARRLEEGAQIYKERNWEQGIPLSEYVDGLIRHTIQFAYGIDDEDHGGGMLFNAMALLHTKELIVAGQLPQELDDLPDLGGVLRKMWRMPWENK